MKVFKLPLLRLFPFVAEIIAYTVCFISLWDSCNHLLTLKRYCKVISLQNYFNSVTWSRQIIYSLARDIIYAHIYNTNHNNNKTSSSFLLQCKVIPNIAVRIENTYSFYLYYRRHCALVITWESRHSILLFCSKFDR